MLGLIFSSNFSFASFSLLLFFAVRLMLIWQCLVWCFDNYGVKDHFLWVFMVVSFWLSLLLLNEKRNVNIFHVMKHDRWASQRLYFIYLICLNRIRIAFNVDVNVSFYNIYIIRSHQSLWKWNRSTYFVRFFDIFIRNHSMYRLFCVRLARVLWHVHWCCLFSQHENIGVISHICIPLICSTPFAIILCTCVLLQLLHHLISVMLRFNFEMHRFPANVYASFVLFGFNNHFFPLSCFLFVFSFDIKIYVDVHKKINETTYTIMYAFTNIFLSLVPNRHSRIPNPFDFTKQRQVDFAKHKIIFFPFFSASLILRRIDNGLIFEFLMY